MGQSLNTFIVSAIRQAMRGERAEQMGVDAGARIYDSFNQSMKGWA